MRCENCGKEHHSLMACLPRSAPPSEEHISQWLAQLRVEIHKRDERLHEMWAKRVEPDKCRIVSCELNGLQLAYKILKGESPPQKERTGEK